MMHMLKVSFRGVKCTERNLATIRRTGRKTGGVGTKAVARVPPPAGGDIPAPAQDPWTEVRDPASGQIYYWNKATNETTALGAPKPSGIAAPQQQESLAGSLGRTVAEGFAFGVGSSVARSMVGSMFGGSSHSDGGGEAISSGGDGGEGDEWDI